MKRFILLGVILLFLMELSAQWTLLNVNMTGVWGSDVQVIDYDNDGDMDIFVIGSTHYTGIGSAILYKNNGNGSFSTVNTGIIGAYRCCSAWGDLNNDGWLDVVVTGRANEATLANSRLYIGSQAGTFTFINTGFQGLDYSWVDIGDYNNDGFADVLMTGTSNGVEYIKLYRNNGNLNFTDIYAGLQRMATGQCHFVDFDNDGDLDISVLGSGNCIIYRNDSTDTFVNINAPLYSLRYSGSAWGDFDNDGFPDLVTTGEGGEGIRTDLYKNNGDGTFTRIQHNLNGTISGSLMWGDYDNDGWLDLFQTGGAIHFGPRTSSLYRNNGDHTFTLQNTSFIPISSSSAAFGDLDNDGKLDLIISGYTGSTYVTKIYKNNTAVANTPPSPPTVVFDQASSTIVFTGTSDATTPPLGLTYNLRIGTSPGAEDVFSVVENSDGYLRKAKRGRYKFYFEPQSLTTYYASAQAIDHTFSGSAFGPETPISLVGIPMIANTGASSIDFGTVSIGDSSATSIVQILNTGTASLRVNGVTYTSEGFITLNTGFPYQIAPGATLSIQCRFVPTTPGTVTATMNIFSTAVNAQQLSIPISGIGVSLADPSEVQNVQIQLSGYDAMLSWEPVTTDSLGFPLSVDAYVIIFSQMLDNFWFLGYTNSTNYTHPMMALYSDMMFYRIKAIKNARLEGLEILQDRARRGEKITWTEAKRYLNTWELER